MFRILFFVFLISVFNISVNAASNGLGSSTFVIDDTASTNNSIEHSKNAIKSVIEMFDFIFGLRSKTLVTFNDPGTKLHIKTNDTHKFKIALSELKTHDGGDCSEMSLSGIELGLKESEPNSHLYVFTDDTPKDFNLVDEVKLLCNEKQSQVVIIVTQNPACLQFNVSFLPYLDVVEACSGQLFYLNDKSLMSWVMPYINESISGQNALLARKTITSEVYTEVPFTFDDLTDYVIISLSGDKVSIDVKREHPNNSKISVDTLAWTSNVKLLKLEKHPGSYTVTARSLSNSSLVVFGRTSFIFQYGFSEFIPESMNETNRQPFGGILSYLTVEDPNKIAELKSVEIDGYTMGLSKRGDSLYMTKQLTVPKSTFTIYVNGKTKSTGQPLRRSAVVNPKIYIAPNYSAPLRIDVLEQTQLEINCPLDSKEIEWYKIDKISNFGTTTESPKKPKLIKEGPDHFYIKNNVVDSDSGFYTCKDKGIHEWTVEVVVGTIPKFTDGSNNNHRNIDWDGNALDLHCDTQSKPESVFEWYYNQQLLEGYTGAVIETFNWGVYVCRVRNVHGSLLRSFRVKSYDKCLINKAVESTMNMPLLLESQSEWAYLEKTERFLVLPTDQELLLSCTSQNYFKKFPSKSELQVVCVEEDKFKVNDEIIKITDLNCIDKVIPTTKIDRSNCSKTNIKSQVVRTGFYVRPLELLSIYEICVDNQTNETIFTKIDMVSTRYEGNMMYNQKSTKYIYDHGLDNSINLNDEYYKGHFVNTQDVIFGPPQLSTNNTLNEVLIFNPTNTTTWNNIEEIIREQSYFVSNSFTVWSGYSDVKKHMADEGRFIPKYLWKMIRNNEKQVTMAVVFINSPLPLVEDKLCKDTCAYNWIQFPESPYIDCCNQEHFHKFYKNFTILL